MRQEGICYDRNGELVRLAGGSVYPVTVDWLKLHLTEVAAFQKYDARSEGWKYCNCSTDIAKTVASMSGLWDLPPLNGIMTCPTITPSGRIIEDHGYDQETGVYLHFPEGKTTWETVNQEPTADDVREAVRTLWEPFREFPFEESMHVGGYLSALLTSIVRPIIGNAPGILIESPSAGSGKTKLAQCLAVLAGSDGAVISKSADEEEMRKSLLAMVRMCSPCVIMDNISGTFRSDSLCAFLTSGMIVSRLLGANEIIQGRSTSMMVFTGNNPAVEGDLNRRIIRVKINPQMEKPYLRTFAFDPVEYVEEHRLKLVRAALTILKASINSGWRHTAGRLASFEKWSDVVRNAVMWLGVHGMTEDLDIEDPVATIEDSYTVDPETITLASLLEVWWLMFGPDGGTVAQGIAAAKLDEQYFSVLEEIAGHNKTINPRSLGKWIDAHEGRIVDKKKFVRKGVSHKVTVWAVKSDDKTVSEKGGLNGFGGLHHLKRLENVRETTSEKGGFDGFGGFPPNLHGEMSNYNNNYNTYIGGVANPLNTSNPPNRSNGQKRCDGCVNFTPNQVNPCSKPGTCPVDPEGKCVRMPDEGKECARFERITH
jgi:hypothetical protein